MSKRIGTVIDVLMYLLLLVQMLYVFTGNNLHEYLGIGFFACLVAHLIIKRKMLLSLFKFKGKSAMSFDQYRYTSPDNTFSSPYDKFNGSIEGSITEVPLFW